jgi:hypothetical protein
VGVICLQKGLVLLCVWSVVVHVCLKELFCQLFDDVDAYVSQHLLLILLGSEEFDFPKRGNLQAMSCCRVLPSQEIRVFC